MRNILLVFMLAAAILYAKKKEESPYKGRVPNGARVFIAPMEGGLDGFIAAELLKQKIPVVVVIDESLADFIIGGVSLKADSHWYDAAFGTGKDKNEGNIRILNVKNKQMIWAGEAGDRSLLIPFYRRGGERKIADRIVKSMKKDLF